MKVNGLKNGEWWFDIVFNKDNRYGKTKRQSNRRAKKNR